MKFEIFREQIILDVYNEFLDCFKKRGDTYALIDPYENEVIGFHYGETHFAVGFIIYGFLKNHTEIYSVGVGILKDYLKNIEKYQKKSSFHWDFNNLALCVLIEFLEKNAIQDFPYSCDELKELIIKQKDSNHGTINWMPMRAYTNWCKYLWTTNEEYLRKFNEYLANVEKAKYQDGFYEDFLPKGKSFNFQYHIYTTSMMNFLSRRIQNVDIPIMGIQRSRDLIDLTGDINYLGRGCNQIFAWGAAFYLFYTCNLGEELSIIMDYFMRGFKIALGNKNLIMNDTDGKERVWWWDYHFSTVYYGHLVFWLAMTYIDSSCDLEIERNKEKICWDSGVSIYREHGSFCCIFNGRKHYLAEKGPLVVNIGMNNVGTVFKGALGPFAGMFGNKYANYVTSIQNYFGPIRKKIYLGKYLIIRNIFPQTISTLMEGDCIVIKFDFGKVVNHIYFSIPLLCPEESVRINLFADEKKVEVVHSDIYYGPYGKTNRLESRILSCKHVRVEIIRR